MHGIRAVSYTHLDVYKRQIVARFEFTRTLFPAFQIDFIQAHRNRDTVFPVSYTHLDVYKRQYSYQLRVPVREAECRGSEGVPAA